MKIEITQTTRTLFYSMLVIASSFGILHSIDYGVDGWMVALPSFFMLTYGFVMVIKTDVDSYYLNSRR